MSNRFQTIPIPRPCSEIHSPKISACLLSSRSDRCHGRASEGILKSKISSRVRDPRICCVGTVTTVSGHCSGSLVSGIHLRTPNSEEDPPFRRNRRNSQSCTKVNVGVISTVGDGTICALSSRASSSPWWNLSLQTLGTDTAYAVRSWYLRPKWSSDHFATVKPSIVEKHVEGKRSREWNAPRPCNPSNPKGSPSSNPQIL